MPYMRRYETCVTLRPVLLRTAVGENVLASRKKGRVIGADGVGVGGLRPCCYFEGAEGEAALRSAC